MSTNSRMQWAKSWLVRRSVTFTLRQGNCSPGWQKNVAVPGMF